ncbi:MAG: NFACT RNA binding domain-containing protein [Bacteroidota bacterium]
MHNNYYFLKILSQELAHRLGVAWQLGREAREVVEPPSAPPMTLMTCFSQSKDELILGFARQGEDLYMQAHLKSDFAALSFPDNFFRAKRNSVDLFPELIELPILQVIQHLNERSFSILFEQRYQLLFKMHGRRSNIILFQDDAFTIAFHKKMLPDQDLNPHTLDRPIEQTESAFMAQQGQISALYPTLSKELKKYIQKEIEPLEPLYRRWEALQMLIKDLEAPRFFIIEDSGKPQLFLPALRYWPQKPLKAYSQHQGALASLNEFFSRFTRLHLLAKEKTASLKTLQKKLKQGQNYLDKNMNRLFELEESSRNEEIANIIMANLHQINEGQSSVELYDFYQDAPCKIRLKKDLSPQKNAESYYRKAKNEKIEKGTLQKNIERKERELATIQEQMLKIETIDNLRELRKYIKQNNISGPNRNQQNPQEHLFKKFEYQGFAIWVGKNAKNNDLLTQQYAYKEDLWLHAKDVSGSHVIIKYQSGKSFPQDVVEKAASLAAYYSKRSNDSLCPVIFTPKKFVRKTKDLAPGQVLVEKEEVIMVVPEKF